MFGSNLGSEVNCKLRSAENVVEEKNTTNSNQFHAQLLISALIFPRLQIIRFASLAYLHSTLNAFPLFSLERQRFLCVCVRECARERERVRAFVYAQHSTQTHIRARVLPHMFVLQSCSPSVCLLCMCESLNVFGGGAAAAHVHSHKFIFIHTNIQTGTHTRPFPPFVIVCEKNMKNLFDDCDGVGVVRLKTL